MFEKVSPNLDFVNREVETVHFWKKHDIFEKSIRNREGGEEFSPSSTARPRPTASPTSAISKPAPSRISSPAIRP